MEAHIKQDCKGILHPCQFAWLGCKEKVIFEESRNHDKEDVSQHLNLAINTIKSLQLQNKAQDEEVKALKETQAAIFDRLDGLENTEKEDSPFTNEYTWKIYNYQKRVDRSEYDSDYMLTRSFLYTERT
ncbi:uncharacterized protein [Clytia hemisphaerica]|uniref:uncharacterized protein n=1 Tax=Clytia hemisphaerica TaxID=252671 RepID=UPI0034D70F46